MQLHNTKFILIRIVIFSLLKIDRRYINLSSIGDWGYQPHQLSQIKLGIVYHIYEVYAFRAVTVVRPRYSGLTTSLMDTIVRLSSSLIFLCVDHTTRYYLYQLLCTPLQKQNTTGNGSWSSSLLRCNVDGVGSWLSWMWLLIVSNVVSISAVW